MDTLTGEQQKVVEHGFGPSLVVAGAGSGKTHTAVERVAYLLDMNVDPASVVLLTFTNKAAAEMTQRVVARCPSAASIESGTFHKMANEYLRRYGCLFSDGSWVRDYELVTKDAKVLSAYAHGYAEVDASYPGVFEQISFPSASACRKASDSLSRGISLEALADRDPDKFSAFAEKEGRMLFYEVERAYADYKDCNRYLTFDDLIESFHRLVEERPEVVAHVRHIVVDEAQDLNQAEYELVCAIADASGCSDVMLIGDSMQSIYGWRGSDVKLFDEFAANCPIRSEHAVVPYRLHWNFRSGKPVLDLANVVASDVDVEMTTELESSRGDVGTADVRSSRNEGEQARDALAFLEAHGMSGTVLFRSIRNNPTFAILSTELSKRGIPFEVRGGTKFSDETVVVEVCSLMALSWQFDPLGVEMLLKRYPGIGDKLASNVAEAGPACLVSNPYMEKSTVTAKRVQAACADLKSMVDSIVAASGVHDKTVAAVKGYRAIRDAADQAMRYAVEHNASTSYDTKKSKLEQLDDSMERVFDLTDLLIDLAADWPLGSTRGFVDSVLLDGNRGVDDEPADVVLSTVHSAKGLEWDSVCVVDASDDVYPGKRDEFDEMQRLLYVAVTRARNHLLVLYPVSRRGSGNPIHPSRYLATRPSFPSTRYGFR